MQGDAKFITTRWSVILRAQNEEPDPTIEENRNKALAILSETYWYPIYAFMRRSGASPADAEDTTQQLFLQLIEKGALRRVAKDKGRFRSYLLAVAKNLMAGEQRRKLARKRGGGRLLESLEEIRNRGEERFLHEPVNDLNPEKLFDRRWADTLFDRAIKRMREEWLTAGRDFEGLKVFLMGDKGDESYQAAASRLGITEIALKARVHRMRREFRDLFKEEVAHTVNDAADVDAEIEYIRNVLSN